MNRISHIITIIAAVIAAAPALPCAAQTVASFPGLEKYVYPGNYVSTDPGICWLPDGETYATLKADGHLIVKVDPRTGSEIETIMDVERTRESSIPAVESFTFSPDGSRILITASSETIFRHSTRGEHYVYEIRSRILRPLSRNHPTQQSPIFSPDSRMVAFADSGNVFIKRVDFDTEVAVTRDGAHGRIINGVPDWTYEEEFSTLCSMAWTADSQTLCYLRYDESQVPLYTLPIYEGACNPRSEYALYPGTMAYKYPMAGEKNSVVTLRAYDVDNRKTLDIPLGSGHEYVPRIIATDDPSRILAVTLNREQTRMEVLGVNPRSSVTASLLVEEARGGWICEDSYTGLTLTPEGFVLPSRRSGWNHLYEYSLTGQMLRQVTSGNFDVLDFYGFDPKAKAYFYRSTACGPVNRVVQRVDAKGKVSTISPRQGVASASFSPGMKWLTITHSTAATPPTVTLHAAASPEKSVRTLIDNAAAAERYASAPAREFFTLEVNGVELNACIVKPSPMPQGKCPVIIYQYSGPGSQEVLDRWAADWTLYYATRGYAVVTIDPRGTGGRGNDFLFADYRNLGGCATADLTAAIPLLGARFPFIDASRAGIHGWSFGGYEALMCATATSSPFKATAAVAPVTDWRFYDSAYTERFMLTPGMNPLGYRNSAPLNRVNNLAGEVLLMWGTMDDNVHPANSLEFVSRMEAAGKWPQTLQFANENHFIMGCNLRAVVYARMLTFFNSTL